MIQAEQGKDELQESRAAGSTRATEIPDQSRSSQKSPKQTMRNEQSAAPSGQQRALKLFIGMAGPASAVSGHNDKIILQDVTQSLRKGRAAAGVQARRTPLLPYCR